MNVTLFANEVFTDVIKLRWSPYPMTEREIWTQTQREYHVTAEQTLEWCYLISQGTARIADNCQSWERGMEQILLQFLQRKPILLTLWFQTFNLNIIKFCCFTPPSLCHCITAALGNEYYFLRLNTQKKIVIILLVYWDRESDINLPIMKFLQT